MQQQFDILIVSNGTLAYSADYALILKDPNLKTALVSSILNAQSRGLNDENYGAWK